MRIAAQCFTLFLALIISLCSPVVAQDAESERTADEDVLTFFYRDPKPERLLGYLEQFDKEDYPWTSYPPLVGFFGVVFGQYPEWIDRLVPSTPTGRMAEALRAAARLSNREVPQHVAERLRVPSTDDILNAELDGLPSTLRDLVLSTPAHLDMLWGAAFASGDKLYPQKIFQFFAATADRSIDIATDVFGVATQLSGGGGEILQGLPLKYDANTVREIVFSASALWSLISNATQHTFVNEALIESATNAKVSKSRDGSLVIEGSIASWIVGTYLSQGR